MPCPKSDMKGCNSWVKDKPFLGRLYYLVLSVFYWPLAFFRYDKKDIKENTPCYFKEWGKIIKAGFLPWKNI